MENDSTYELISLLSKPSYINTDLKRAFSLIQNAVENTYVKKIYQMAENENKKVNKSPSKEVVLLKAVKNFSSPQASAQIDRIITLFNTMDVINGINRSVLSYNPPINIKSSDEKDEPENRKHIAAAADILFILALANRL